MSETQCKVYIWIGRGRYGWTPCELKAGHPCAWHQHTFRNWTARRWSNGRFRFFAKFGKSLPLEVCK